MYGGLRRAGSLCRGNASARFFARRKSPGNLYTRPLSTFPRLWTHGNQNIGQISRTWRIQMLPRKMFCSSSYPSHTEVTLPALSPTMETGTLIKWEVEIGEQLEEGDIIAQVETDKATMDMETPCAGYLATIIVPEGTSDLPLGKVLAIVVEDKSLIDSFKDYKVSNKSEPVATLTSATPTQESQNTVEEKDTTPSPSVNLPPHSLVPLPALSPTMETGSVVKWDKTIGDLLEEGDIIAEIETDKATMDMETPAVGYLAAIIAPEGTRDIQLGSPLAVIVENKEDLDTFKDYIPPVTQSSPITSSPSPPIPQSRPTATPAMTTPTKVSTNIPNPNSNIPSIVGRVLASPFAKKLAQERGVEIQSVKGSGPGGRIIGRDIPQSAVGTSPSVTTSPVSVFEDIPLTGMRKTIANRLQLSKQTIPHYYLSIDINMEDVTRLRKQINSDDMKLSVNDFIIKAAALSMKSVPEVNSSFMDTFIRKYNNVDISVAVSTPGGLITPIVFDADTKGLQAINNDVRDLAEKARSGKLKPHEFQGGTFTISNLGMFGIKNFSAVINPPQACILAVGTTEKRLIVNESNEIGYSSAPMMSVTLSCDHRVVDGAVGANWLNTFRSYLEKPFKMLI